jgi:hypothetical protein
MHEKDKVGAKRAVDDQFAAPMAVRPLLPQEIFLRATNRLRDLDICGR